MKSGKEDKSEIKIADSSASTQEIMKTFIAKPSLLKEDIYFNESDMQKLLQQKKESRVKKGKPFNAFVLNDDEVTRFFKLLSKNLDKYPDNTRFQLAMYDEDVHHWYAMDCFIKDKKLHTLVVDPAQVPECDTIHELLKDTCPAGLHYSFTGNKKEKEILQFDNFSCSIFAREMISRLSNLDTDKLYLALNQFAKKGSCSFGIKDITGDMTVLSPLLRTVQSMTAFSKIPKEAKQSLVSSKGLTLEQFIKNQTLTSQKGEKQNVSITVKAFKYKDKLKKMKLSNVSDTNGFGFIALPEMHIFNEITKNKSKEEAEKIIKQFTDSLLTIKSQKGWFVYNSSSDIKKIVNDAHELIKNCSSVVEIANKFSHLLFSYANMLVSKNYSHDLNSLQEVVSIQVKSLNVSSKEKTQISEEKSEISTAPTLSKK